MENHQLAENYVQYNTELKILTCIQHKHAIPPGNDENNRSKIDRHFQDTNSYTVPFGASKPWALHLEKISSV
jgi:hypothetical protein